MKSIIPVLAILIIVLAAGCGEKEDYKERFLKLQEQHEKEIARLREQHKEERESYDRKLRSYAAKLSALRKNLAAAKELLDETKKSPASAPGLLQAGEGTSFEEEIVQHGEEAEASVDIASSAQAPTDEIDYILEWFAWNYASFIDADMKEEYKKDFSDYIAGLREQSTSEPVSERKEKMLSGLQEQIDQTTDESEKEQLQSRMEKIQNAGEEDIEGILDYYQKLDNIEGLNHLMEKYNISREELREAGIIPPPRGNWGPDAKEIAYNLNNFVSNYAPLTNPGEREQFRKDFSDYVSDLTTPRTDAQVLQERDQMLMDLEERYKTASDREKQWLERRRRRLQNSDIDRLRRRIQINRLLELNQLTRKYDIPSSELRQSGVWLPRRRHPGR